jgi:hypothetical protein
MMMMIMMMKFCLFVSSSFSHFFSTTHPNHLIHTPLIFSFFFLFCHHYIFQADADGTPTVAATGGAATLAHSNSAAFLAPGSPAPSGHRLGVGTASPAPSPSPAGKYGNSSSLAPPQQQPGGAMRPNSMCCSINK